MTSGDLLDEAVAELYSADPEEFTRRRQELAGRARSAGQVPVAKQIAALRKPTRSAWVVNQLARSDPGSVSRLTALGAELRAAERSGDGSRMRELAQARRRLIAALVRQALAVSGQAAAPAALREEITSTFAAALADPEVAGQIQRGMLLRAASRPGFGTAEMPSLTVVPPLPDQPAPAKPKPAGPARTRPAAAKPARAKPPPAKQPPAKPAPAKPARAKPARPAKPVSAAARAEAARTARAEATADRDRREGAVAAAASARARSKAERALADADDAARAAREDEQQQQATVARLEQELAEARHRLRMAAATAREAEITQRRLRQALDRLPD